jgi:CO/xanthine dehydrogenase Mo-binding subunit
MTRHGAHQLERLAGLGADVHNNPLESHASIALWEPALGGPAAGRLTLCALPGRPVKLALTRQQMFALAGHRTPTIQSVRVAADGDGRLQAQIATDALDVTVDDVDVLIGDTDYPIASVAGRSSSSTFLHSPEGSGEANAA